MNCYIHEQRAAIGTCVHCGKFICEDCKTELKGKNYCKKCVDEIFDENKKRIDDLENRSSQGPMVFMNSGGGGGGSSSSSSSSAAASGAGSGVRYICTKSKIVAGILAIFLGGIGVHKFYLGNIGLGIVYLLFCWTTIPAIIGCIEGIIILCKSDEAFNTKYGKPVMY